MILHICTAEKFIPAFIDLVNSHFCKSEHNFWVQFNKNYPTPNYSNVEVRNKKNTIFSFSRLAIKIILADKIIIHGLFSLSIVMLLFFMPWVMPKCFWAVWGGDLYRAKQLKKSLRWKFSEYFRKRVIRHLGNIITTVDGDFELAKKWYLSRALRHKCFMYPSNMYHDISCKQKSSDITNILVGNSADPSNEHLFIFERLVEFKNTNIKIFVPLSYGNKKYANVVVKKGYELFNDKFIPLTDFLPFEKYLHLLNEIDIAIFHHNRQQAMGNIRTLLGLGKKVYLRTNITSTEYLSALGVKTFDIQDLDLKVDFVEKEMNQAIIKNTFNFQNLVHCLDKIFKYTIDESSK